MDKKAKAKRIAIGFSGTGSTFKAIQERIASGKLNLEIGFVFSDRPCLAKEKADALGIKVIQKKPEEDISDFHRRVVSKLESEEVDLVVLAGYLRLFPIRNKDPFLVINSHPAAIPEFGGNGFYGERVHELVYAFASTTNFRNPYTYSTIHIASQEYDEGEILGLRPMKIGPEDTPKMIAEKLLPIEHQNYIEVLERFSKDELRYFQNPPELVLPGEKAILKRLRKKILERYK